MAKNIIDDLFDIVVLAGKSIKFLTYKALRIEEFYDLELFFKNAGLKNGSGEKPKQKSVTTGTKGDIYHLSIPDGLSSKDFEKYKQALEEKYNEGVEINCDKGVVKIEMFKKVES